jgi:acetyl-CoA acetyltransferase
VNPLRGKVAAIGVGTTAQGELGGRSAEEISIEAFKLALADAGLGKTDIDGLIVCPTLGGRGSDVVIGRMAGLNPRFSATLQDGMSNFSLHLAVMAIASGMARTVAIMYGTNQRSSRRDRQRFAEVTPAAAHEGAAYGIFNIAGPAALAFRRHQHLYGTTEEQLGHIAVSQRRYAQLNPLAVFREPMDLDDYLASRYIVRPLRRPDICMISDGGACVILTDAERAADVAARPVQVLAIDQATGLRGDQNADNLLRPWMQAVGERIYALAGVERADVDVLYIQDATSVWVLQMLEWFGFCKVGEGGPYLESGEIGFGGKLPLNTNGGQLSESYMWGWLHLCEAIRQLRGGCGPRQVPGAQVAQFCSAVGFHRVACSILSAAA